MADRAIHAFLNDPDPASRRVELLAFVGPRPEGFLDLYDCLASKRDEDPLRRVRHGLFYNGFSAPAFFLGPVYFFYRKMWLWGSAYVAAMLVIAVIPVIGRADIGLAVAMAFLARWLYLRHAIRHIIAIRAASGENEQVFLATLAQTGGVSKAAGWISGILFVAAITLAAVQTMA